MRDWRKKKEVLQSMPKMRKMMRVGREPQWPELEQRLYDWVQEKRKNGILLSGTMIRLKAKSIEKDHPDLSIGFTG